MKRWILVGWLLTLAIAAAVIVGKERVLRHGDVLYLRLAPVDPRSLMQGDYMALNFSIGIDITAAQRVQPTRARREEVVVVRRDANQEGHFVRLYDGKPLAPDEHLLRVQHVPTRWGSNAVQVSTDAWFFQEGQAQRYARAQYGEFRVDADGRALLVGMRGEGMTPM
ncbi:GDYXXLXY domain-containing protein [Cupriavidus sp. H19C3]|uniref:GDYXXLXY domain-containing protein n=1 Tax=Cupriavidus sp. H19C3 TaxID=3241603 RepID=UPI003BF8F8ED